MKCGVNLIAVITILFLIAEFIAVMFLFQNVYFDKYFCVVWLVLLIPIFVAVIFFIMFWFNDTKRARKRIAVGCILVIVAMVSIGIWNIVYINKLYKYDAVYFGTGKPNTNPDDPDENMSSNYIEEDKKAWLIENFTFPILIVAIYLLFWSSCNKYAESY